MAKVFPEWISDNQKKSNPKHRAEFYVYEVLKESLSDDWCVFYSCTWSWIENESNTLDVRETDFIIAHPDYGILLLEVKGGRIVTENSQWFSIDRNGRKWKIQNPYSQVAIAVKKLKRRLMDEESLREI